jgi:hypothetical protein
MILGAGACGDLPTRVEVPGAAVQSRGVARPAGVGADVVCTTSQAITAGPYAYRYGRLALALPASARAPGQGTTLYRFRSHARGRIVAAATCRIPDTDKAVAYLDRLFGVKERGGRRDRGAGGSGGVATVRSSDAPVLPLDGLTVNACQYGGDYPFCNPPPLPGGSTKAPKDNQICYVDCGDSWSPDGGGSSDIPPDPEEDPVPCQTGDPVLDSPAVQERFKLLWDTARAATKETGAWVVRNEDGTYGTVPLSVQSAGACEINFLNNPPTGTVAWIHVHPFNPGDRLGACGTPNLKYPGGASPHDQLVTDQLGGMRGLALDGQQINEFHGSSYQIQRTYRRCGY